MKTPIAVHFFFAATVFAADDFANAKEVVTKYISANFTDDFLTTGFNSIYSSVQNNAKFAEAHEEFEDEMIPLLLTQTDFVGPFAQLTLDVGSVTDLIDTIGDTLTPNLQSAYSTIRNAKPSNKTEFSNLIVQVAPKKFFAEALNDIQAVLDAKTWNYLVSNLYCVINFSVYGIKKT